MEVDNALKFRHNIQEILVQQLMRVLTDNVWLNMMEGENTLNQILSGEKKKERKKKGQNKAELLNELYQK